MSDLCLVGYTYRDFDTPYVMDRAREFGYAAVELRDFADIDLSDPIKTQRSLDYASAIAREHEVIIQSLFYAPLPISRENEYLDVENAFCEVIAHTAAYGIPVLHTRLSISNEAGEEIDAAHKATEADYEAIRSTLARITPMAEIHKVRIAVEAHMGTIHDTAESLLRIVTEAESPALTASLDFANILIGNRQERLTELPKRFGSHLGYIHLKNVRFTSDGYEFEPSLRDGDIDYVPILRALFAARYAGPLAVEYCGSAPPDVVAKDDADFLRELVSVI